jgi:MFS family permease
VLFGAGTALAYPTLIAAVGDVAHPSWRGAAVGVYRLWRDLGFAVGGVLAGVLADLYSLEVAILVVAAITAASGIDVALRMKETHPSENVVTRRASRWTSCDETTIAGHQQCRLYNSSRARRSGDAHHADTP